MLLPANFFCASAKPVTTSRRIRAIVSIFRIVITSLLLFYLIAIIRMPDRGTFRGAGGQSRDNLLSLL
jgi:hypothetical protein